MDGSTRIERRMRALAMAKECADLGARVRTIHHITGIGTRELVRLLFTEHHLPPRGRAPDTREWYHAANLLSRTEASVIASNSLRNPSRTAPSRFIPPNSPVGQATQNRGALKLPPAMACAPSP